MKYLVIAEKPSVARSISKVIGAYKHEDGYLEGGDCVVSWCLGHLAEYAAPEYYDERYKSWRFDDLPILPEEWKLLVSEDKKAHFNILRKLLRSKDFDYVVNACDAGREGEAIFRRVYGLAGSKLPVKRLWISSMEDTAIQQGFDSLKDGTEYDNLFAASECRAKADWLIGMNGTRAFTKKYGRRQTIGRVQTPTLAMLTERQNKIQNFVKEPYYKVEITGNGIVAESERMVQEQNADTVQAACDGQCAVVGSIERKRKEQSAPKLYDLTTLQREANRYYGFTASQGHIGTWYAVDETEVGGEKFFLLEHEEHGDMAACVAVNEQGKLVAEDLWNGFDEDFQEAVQKYLSEKWNMPKKEDVVSEIIEKTVPVPDNSAQDYSDVPVYYEPFSYAKENDEVDLYRTSYRLNTECKQAIHEAIADNYDGMYLGDGAVDQVVRQYGMERVGYILANTLHHKSYDDRFSHGNKEWAEQVSTPEHNADRMTFRTDWVVDNHPAILDGFVTMYRNELEAQKRQEQPFVKQFYVVENLQDAPLKIERFGNLDDAMSQYQALPNHYMKALGVEKNPDPLPGSLDILQCKNGIDTIVENYKTVPGWDNQYIQNHVVQPLQGALAVQDVELAYELPDAYFHIQTCDDGFDYTLYNKNFTERDGGILETDGDKSVQEAMTELLTEFGCNAEEGRVMDAAELREQADTVAEQQAEALKEKLAAEKPTPEATISFYVAECAEFPVMGEFHDNLTLEQALEVYDKIPAERMNGIKSIGFSLEDGSIYSGMFDLMVGGEVQADVVNHIQHYRESPLVQKAISDIKTLLEKRQASKELEERPNTRQSVREALKNRKKAQEQQSNQEQAKPKKAKKKGEMEL